MKSKFTLEHEINYAPTVIRIGEHIHYDNMDNLVGINHNGLVALVSKRDPNYATDQLALFVPVGAQISEHFTRKLNLYRDITKNADSTATPGYLEPNRRIKAIRLRGVVSSGLVLPISFFTNGILEPGTQFDTINGEEFSRKYIVPVKVSNQKTKAKTLQPLVAEEFFPEHFNTPFLLPNLDRLDPDMPIYVTQKLHGTSCRLSKTYLNNPNVFQRLFHLPTKRKKLGFVVGSHRVVKDSRLPQQHYYGVDIWNEVGSKYRDLIPDNYILYGEIIGWVNESTPIQRDYTYDQAPGSATFLVYRISIVLPDGRTTDLSFPQMREFCNARGLRTVPLLDIIRASDITPEYLEKFTDVDFSTLSGLIEKPILLSDSTLPDEGITLRQDRDIPLILKYKSPLFYVHESLMMDMEIVDIEE